MSENEDKYLLFWKYVIDNGEIKEEEFDGLTLEQFEVLYGNNPWHILQITLIKKVNGE